MTTAERGPVVADSVAPTRRDAIDQALAKKWAGADREQRIKIAKAFLGDAVQRQSDEHDGLSMRVIRGISLLGEALAHQQRCPTCNGKGTVSRDA